MQVRKRSRGGKVKVKVSKIQLEPAKHKDVSDYMDTATGVLNIDCQV